MLYTVEYDGGKIVAQKDAFKKGRLNSRYKKSGLAYIEYKQSCLYVIHEDLSKSFALFPCGVYATKEEVTFVGPDIYKHTLKGVKVRKVR